MNKRALVFDLDDTLYPESTYFEAVFSLFCERYGWPKSSFTNLLGKFSQLRTNQKDLFGFFLDQNLELWKHKNDNCKNSFRQRYHLELFELYKSIQFRLKPNNGAEQLIKSAHFWGLKLGVLTNGVPAAQLNKWKCLEIPYKEEVIFVPARECIQEKPAPDSFHLLSQNLEVELSNAIFIGDRYENDLAYPLSQGAIGILLQNEGENICVHENYFHATNLKSAELLIQKIIDRDSL